MMSSNSLFSFSKTKTVPEKEKQTINLGSKFKPLLNNKFKKSLIFTWFIMREPKPQLEREVPAFGRAEWSRHHLFEVEGDEHVDEAVHH